VIDTNYDDTDDGTVNETRETFQKQLFDAIRADLAKTGAKVLIIDNLTALTLKTTTDADAAMGLMRSLKKLQADLEVSILVLAHTTKIPNYVPIQLNQLGGSKHLANFADSVFAIAKSNQDENIRYLKQLKVRNAELEYGQHNVVVIRKQRTGAFLGFEFVGTSSEMEHLVGNDNANEKQQKSEMVIQLHDQGLSQRLIAEQTGIPLTTVNRIIQTSSSK
jgi:hypothetical protein